MNETILRTQKNGMAMLLLWGVLYLASIGLLIYAAFQMEAEAYAVGVPLLVISVIWFCVGWVPFMGLKPVPYTQLLVHETKAKSACRLLFADKR